MAIEVAGRIYFTVEDIQEKTGMNIRYIRDMIKTGRLKGHKQGRRWYVSERNPQAFFEGETQANQ